MAAPPFDTGGVKLTVTCPFPLTPVAVAGAPGATAVVDMTLEAGDGALAPSAFVAITVNV